MRKLLLLAALVFAVFAGTASASWNGLNFPRNGSFYATPGTYYDTPEWLYAQQTAGPCSNIRLQLRRVSDGSVLYNAPTAAYGCPFGKVLFWKYRDTVGPDWPGGVRIWIVAGPADGQTIGAYVCGGPPQFLAGC